MQKKLFRFLIVYILGESATQCQVYCRKDIFFGFFPVFLKRPWHIPRIFMSMRSLVKIFLSVGSLIQWIDRSITAARGKRCRRMQCQVFQNFGTAVKILEVGYEIFDPGYDYFRLGYNIQRLVADFEARFGNFTRGLNIWRRASKIWNPGLETFAKDGTAYGLWQWLRSATVY